MNSFWGNIYDDVKDRRYGTLFFATFFISLGIVLLIVLLSFNFNSEQMREIAMVSLPVVILTIIITCWRWLQLERKYRKDRLKFAHLSRDELAKARSKLKKQMKPASYKVQAKSSRRPPPRAPDINLKY